MGMIAAVVALCSLSGLLGVYVAERGIRARLDHAFGNGYDCGFAEGLHQSQPRTVIDGDDELPF